MRYYYGDQWIFCINDIWKFVTESIRAGHLTLSWVRWIVWTPWHSICLWSSIILYSMYAKSLPQNFPSKIVYRFPICLMYPLLLLLVVVLLLLLLLFMYSRLSHMQFTKSSKIQVLNFKTLNCFTLFYLMLLLNNVFWPI